jgi:hypothetical protein
MLLVENSVRELVKATAHKKNRSASNYVECLILEDLGLMPKTIDIQFDEEKAG